MKGVIRKTRHEGQRSYIPSFLASRFLILLFCVIVFFPIAYTFMASFMTLSEFLEYPPRFFPRSFVNFDNYAKVFSQAPMARYMLNSLIVATVGSLVRLAFALMAAYAIVFYDFRGSMVVFALVLGTMMLSGDTLLVANFLMVARLGLFDTYFGIMAVYLVSPLHLFVLRQSFKSQPKDIRDQALLDGCGDFGYMRHVLLPMSGSVLYALYVQSFVSLWNLYLWPLMVTTRAEMRTVQVGLTMLTTADGTNFDVVMAGVASILVPSFVIFGIMMRKKI